MATIERVMQLQQQGYSDADIIRTMTNEGDSPKDIQDSLAQAKIKTAVNQAPEGYMQQADEMNNPQQQYQQAPQAQYPEQAQPPYQEQTQQYAQYQEQQPMQNTETISEIIDQMMSEKLRELTQKTKAISEFKSQMEDAINDIKERLKRIEGNMDNLQRGVINKVGEFGQSNAMVQKDLENLHGTVSKLMNPLIDNYNELKKINGKK